MKFLAFVAMSLVSANLFAMSMEERIKQMQAQKLAQQKAMQAQMQNAGKNGGTVDMQKMIQGANAQFMADQKMLADGRAQQEAQAKEETKKKFIELYDQVVNFKNISSPTFEQGLAHQSIIRDCQQYDAYWKKAKLDHNLTLSTKSGSTTFANAHALCNEQFTRLQNLSVNGCGRGYFELFSQSSDGKNWSTLRMHNGGSRSHIYTQKDSAYYKAVKCEKHSARVPSSVNNLKNRVQKVCGNSATLHFKDTDFHIHKKGPYKYEKTLDVICYIKEKRQWFK